jgi:dihydropteroate synthase
MLLKFNDRNKVLDISQPKIMGILNVTPDSFSDGGQHMDTGAAVAYAAQMLEEGADIIDIGGESTRPGSDYVPDEEEWRRIGPVIKALRLHSEVPISVDTRKASVAEKALDSGADIINDISALRDDPELAGVLRRHRCPVIVMHMQGTPATMQTAPVYDDVVREVGAFLDERVGFCREMGIDQVIVDPGIGFGKTVEDNLALLANLRELIATHAPILVGASRKRFLGSLCGTDTANRLHASIAAHTAALLGGASILRVHDVRPHVEAMTIANAIASQARKIR